MAEGQKLLNLLSKRDIFYINFLHITDQKPTNQFNALHRALRPRSRDQPGARPTASPGLRPPVGTPTPLATPTGRRRNVGGARVPALLRKTGRLVEQRAGERPTTDGGFVRRVRRRLAGEKLGRKIGGESVLADRGPL